MVLRTATKSGIYAVCAMELMTRVRDAMVCQTPARSEIDVASVSPTGLETNKIATGTAA